MKKILFLLFILMSCEQSEIKISDRDFHDKLINLTSEQKKYFLDSTFKDIKSLKSDSVRLNLLFDVAAEFDYLNDKKSSFIASHEAFLNAEEIKDSFSMGRALYYMGDCYLNFKKDSAFYYYKESEKLFRKLKNYDRLAKVHYNKAYLLFYEGNYVESEIEVIKALGYLKDSDNLISKYRCYSLQGSNHLELGELNNTLDYFKKASTVLEEMKKKGLEQDDFYNFNVINNIDVSNVYVKQKKYDKSILLLKKVLKENSYEDIKNIYPSILGNLAYSLMKNGNYDEAKKYFEESISLTKDKDNQSYLYKIIDYGEYFLEIKDTVKAIDYLTESLILSKKLKSSKETLKTLKLLSIADENNEAKYNREYILINDSLVRKQRENREKFARIEYETEQVVSENEVLTSKNLRLLLFLSVLSILFLVIAIIYYNRTKKKELFLLEQKNNADKELFELLNDFQIEVENTKRIVQDNISKELHDGIMNQLYGVRLNLGLLNAKTDDNSIEKRLFYLKKIKEIEGEVRNLSHNLLPEENFNKSNFSVLLKSLIDINNSNPDIDFEILIANEIDWNEISSLIKVNVYRILQELIQNVIKYSEATKCNVNINFKSNELLISFKDNGVGFDTNKNMEGSGLNNIMNRVKIINGEIFCDSKIRIGTEYNIKIPIKY